MAKSFELFSMLLLLTSCAINVIKTHTPKDESTAIIQTANRPYAITRISGSTMDINKTIESPTIYCRVAMIEMPSNKTVRDYIAETFQIELSAAKKFKQTGNPIEASVNVLSTQTGTKKGQWMVDIDYTVNLKPYHIVTSTEFETSLDVKETCTNAAHMFETAISQNFVELFKQINPPSTL